MRALERQPWRVLLSATAAVAALATSGCDASDDEATTAAEAPIASSDSIELYFIAGEQFAKVEREVPAAGDELERAARALLAGPIAADSSARFDAKTQIPAEVELEQVAVDSDGTATVRLSAGFTQGIPTDPAARSAREDMDLSARLGQVTYTLTEFDEVEAVEVVSGGETVVRPSKRGEPALERADYAKPARGPEHKLRPRGPKSAGTRVIQKRLARLRYLPRSAVDGIEGYRTQQAVIAFQSWRGLARDGIVGPATSAALARASRPKPKGDGPARRIEVHREKGVALLVEAGKVKRAIHVSTGAPRTETPAGTYTVFRKELQSWSVPFRTWLPYASYFNQGIAFHEYPDVPTFPASHGCVRVPAPEAKGVYEFATVGTAVVVI